MKKNLVTKTLSLLLVGVMMLSLAACSNDLPKETTASSTKAPESTGATVEVEPTTEESGAVTYPMDTDKTLTVYLGNSATLNAEYKSYDESYWHSHVSEVTGIDTVWIPKVQDATAAEMMLSDPKEAPNVFFTGSKGVDGYKQYVEDGLAIELTDYLEEYAPNYWEYIHRPENAEKLKQVTDDEGRFYFIPSMVESDFNLCFTGPMIRQDWLEECGLKAPVTLEDYENVLVAFKEKYGATFGAAWKDLRTAGLASGTGAFIDLTGGFRVRDGKMVCENMSPEWQKYVEVLADWQKKGLLDGDIFTADRNILRQKVAEGKVGMTVTAMSQLTMYIQDAEEAGSGAEWVGIEYPRTAAGEPTSMIQTNHLWVDYSAAMISAFCPEELIPIALAWMDYFFTEEGIVFSNFGIEGETYEMVDGHPTFTKLVTEDPAGMASAVTKYGAWNGSFIGIQMEDFIRAKNALTPAVLEAIDAWTTNTNARDNILPKFTLTADEKQKYSDVFVPINTYIRERVAAYIKGDEAIDWDKFEKTLEDMGIQTAVDIYQAAYDRSLNK